MSVRIFFGMGATVLAFVLGLWMGKGSPAQAAGSDQVFELRTYTTNSDRLPDLIDRFRTDIVRLLNKHGIKSVGYWVPQDEPRSKDTMIFLLSFPSREAAKERWGKFESDPEWGKVREEMNKNGRVNSKIESVFMVPTDFSPMK